MLYQKKWGQKIKYLNNGNMQEGSFETNNKGSNCRDNWTGKEYLMAIEKAATRFPHAMILGCKAMNKPVN
jgi:hypothetical protein